MRGKAERVFITGMGYVTPAGAATESVLDVLKHDRAPFARSPVLEGAVCCPAAPAPLEDTSAACWRHRRYLNRGAALMLGAGLRAARNAGFADVLPAHAALITATGPMLDMDPGVAAVARGGPVTDADALWLLRWLPNMGGAALARHLGIHGEGLVLTTACAASLQALGEGLRRIRFGLTDTVLAAAGDSRLSLGGLLGYARAQAMFRHAGPDAPPAPESVCRPFDAERRGFVPGEGGAAFVLESETRVRERGAAPLAELLGFGASLDGGNLTAPDPEGRFAAAAVRGALHDAGVEPVAVDWVAAHGTGTVLNDQAEARMLETVFAGARPAVTALKSWIGHGAAACGALELALLLTTAEAGFIPAVRNLQTPCSPHLDFVREHRSLPGRIGLLENFGFGGQNAALIVRLKR